MKLRYQILTLSSTLIFIGCGGGGSDSIDPSETASSTGASARSVTITTPNPFPADLLSQDTITVYLNAINAARATGRNCGTRGYFPKAPALRWNTKLYGAAMEHSTDLAQSGTFSHSGSGTSSDWTGIEYGKQSTSQERTENNGYQDWRAIGENLHAGGSSDTAEIAVSKWIDSDGHCAVLMNPVYTEVGMALVYEADSRYKYYWSQNFGAKR